MRGVKATHAASEARRRAFLLVLAAGAAVSLALLVGALWVPWAAAGAVAVALLAGVIATAIVRREVRAERADAAARLKAERAGHRAHLSALHAEQREVLGVVDARIRAVARELTESRTELAEMCRVNARLRGDNAALRQENTRLRGRIEELEATPDGADVVSLPRRRVGERREARVALDSPTVVDLDIARLATPFVEELRRAHAN